MKHRRSIGMLLAATAVWAAAAGAQAPGPPSSDPRHLTRLGDAVYFTADDGIHGRELWRTDGTPEGTWLAVDLTPGPQGTVFREQTPLYATETALLFLTHPIPSQIRLHATDGTPEGTRVLDTYPHSPGTRLHFLAARGPRAYFNLHAGPQLVGLWVTDGTPEGTRMVPFKNEPDTLTYINQAEWTDTGDLLLVSDLAQAIGIFRAGADTAERITPIHTLVPASGVAVLGGAGYFAGRIAPHNHELCRIDLADHTVSLVTEIHPGPDRGVPGQNEIKRFGALLLFRADDGAHGVELWRSDGTAEGTRIVKDINPGLLQSDPYNFQVLDGVAVFVAMHADYGRELWRTDGTAEGTFLLRDVNPGLPGSDPYALCVAGDRVIFSALHAGTGEELWVTDGTPGGTRPLGDLNPGPDSSYPYYTTALDGRVLFAATTAAHGRELWVSDGTPEGTRLLMDIFDAPRVNPASDPAHLTPAGDRLFFVANDLEHGAELWVTDGTEAGTAMVRDIFPGPAGSNPAHLVYNPVRGVIFFAADDGRYGVELWRSDGTAGGTTQLQDFQDGPKHGGPADIVVDDEGHVFCTANTGSQGLRGVVWCSLSDGTAVLPGTVKDIPGWRPRELAVAGRHVFFIADDGNHGEELWVVDSRAHWPARIARDIALPVRQAAAPAGLTRWGSHLAFVGEDADRRRLWQAIGDPVTVQPLPPPAR